jgi:hypothetical protein
MHIGRILDPELRNSSMEEEVAAIYREVQHVTWRLEEKSSLISDDRLFMDVTGFGLDIYRVFCSKYPELANRIIPMKSYGRL